MVKFYLLSSLATIVLIVVFLSGCAQEDPGFILLGVHEGQIGSSYYTLQPDGAELHLIHQIPTENLMPVLSPNGQKIVYFNGPDLDGRGEPLAIMNIDGTDPMTLTTGSGHISPPAWSPDGQRIAYVRSNASLHIINIDGSGDIDLSQALLETNSRSQYLAPIWAPDGQKIAFLERWGKGYNIYVSNSDGTNPIKITTLAVDYLPDPVWSPDGQQITYADPSKEAIYVVGVDGTQPKRLTPAPADYRLANVVAWSPDGQRLAFTAWSLEVDKPHFRVFTVNSDGTNLISLYDDDLRGGASFAWSPDGQRLAFAAGGPFFNSDLYIVNADGGNLTHVPLAGISSIERIQWGRLVKDN